MTANLPSLFLLLCLGLSTVVVHGWALSKSQLASTILPSARPRIISSLPASTTCSFPQYYYFKHGTVPTARTHARHGQLRWSLQNSNTDFDMEYIPPTGSADSSSVEGPEEPIWKDQFSYFSPNVPSGLRAEAILSALSNGRDTCVGMRHSSQEWYQLTGPYVYDFLQAKLGLKANKSNEIMHWAGLLNAKGQLLDLVGVYAYNATTVYLQTQVNLETEWELFPLDRVTLSRLDKDTPLEVFSVYSARHGPIQKWVQSQLLPVLPSESHADDQEEATSRSSSASSPWYRNHGNPDLLIIPGSIRLPPNCVTAAYTVLIWNQKKEEGVFETLSQDSDNQVDNVALVPLGEREYHALRVFSGLPRWTGDRLASPLEWQLQQWVFGQDDEKEETGCFLGQEAVAAMKNNPAGPPRQLYQWVCNEDENSDWQDTSRLTTKRKRTWPRAGDTLHVLGSNGEIVAGTVVEVSEPGSGHGRPALMGLCLIRRSSSILKKMKEMELEIPKHSSSSDENDMSSGVIDVNSETGKIIRPPPLQDPLEGLEVFAPETLLMGRLQSVPWKRLPQGTYLIDNEEEPLDVDELVPKKNNFKPVVNVAEEKSSNVEKPSVKTSAEAAAEAQRKAEKMAMLQKRAAEAMARRNKKK